MNNTQLRKTHTMKLKSASIIISLGALSLALTAGSGISKPRLLPELPTPGERIRVIIDTDAGTEIDDVYALALALVAQDRFDIEGIVGAHFGDAGGPDGVEKSLTVIHELLDIAGMTGQFPVKPGAPPFQFSAKPPESEGVDFIIERAMATDERGPLWVIALGPCTDVAAAYLKNPKIAERMVLFWHGRTQWPERCWNFNAYNDLKAVRVVFESKLPLVLFDTGTYLRCPMEESKARIWPHGKIGRYLHDFRLRNEHYQSPRKGFYDLGDVAALIDPSLTYSEVVSAPGVDWDLRYDFRKDHGRILRIFQIDRDRTFELLSQKLKGFDKTGD